MRKSLWTGGNEVLLKAVVQAISSYSMSAFHVPKGFCKELSSLCANFWWVKGATKEGYIGLNEVLFVVIKIWWLWFSRFRLF